MDSTRKIVPSNGEGEFKKLFDTVTEKYRVSVQSLSKITGINEEVIVKQEYGPELTSLQQMIVMLSTGMEMVDENERVKGIIEVLNYVFNITNETIALYSKVDVSDVELFLNDYNLVSFEKRYRIATTTLFLHYLFKPNASTN